MDISVTAPIGETSGTLSCGGLTFKCILGRTGIALEKREGDGVTPVGRFPIRHVYWRADRIEKPDTPLDATTILPTMGWCDDPASPHYNLPVTLPFNASHEKLWRDDHVYDLIVVLGYNDSPVIPGMGSAIFMHLAQPDNRPTEGCVALTEPDLRAVLARLTVDSIIEITAG